MSTAAAATAFRAQAQVLLWRFGWSWPLAAAAAVLAALLHVLLVLPARDALALARADLGRATVQAGAAQAGPPPASEADQVRFLQAALRSADDPTRLIRRLGELAKAEQIPLAQGEYLQQFHPQTQLLQVQVSQPLKAGYPQLKRYIASVLRTMPNASLDQIAARRENVGQAQLEVRLRWSFWVHTPKAMAREEARP